MILEKKCIHTTKNLSNSVGESPGLHAVGQSSGGECFVYEAFTI